MANRPSVHSKKTHKSMSKRCQFPKCSKLGKDLVDCKVLCRIHSPMRKGFQKIEKEKKKNA